jgi:hypothetical protein
MLPISDPQTYPQLSQQGDPPADAVVQALIAGGCTGGDLLARVEALARAEGGVCQAFLDSASTPPPWLRPADLPLGQELFLRCAPLSIACFVLGSLPLTYLPPGSARVLLHTGRLRQDVLRRLYETATLVQQVMRPGAMAVGQPGWRAVLRVRLLHAMVRQHVRIRVPDWPHERLGAPINQLQMGLTALGFSLVIVKGLRRLGVAVTDAEARAYQHLWRCANALQGVDLRLLPDTLDDEARLYEAYAHTLMQPDANSRTLVAAVHQALAWQSPFFLPQGALEAASRRILGAALCDRLAIPRHPVWAAVLALAAALHRATAIRHRVPGWRAWELRWGRRYFDTLVARGLAGQPADYAMKASA